MNAIAKQTTGTTVANPHTSNPYSAYAAEASTRTIVGTLLKFAKGEWTKGQNDNVVPLGTKFVADMRNVMVGWIRWENKKPVEHRIGRIADNYRPEARPSLGYNDKSQWEIDEKSDKANDPWQQTSLLFLMSQESGIFTWSPSSAGGRNAVIKLCGAYGKLFRQHPGHLPVMEIGTDSYRHAEYGKTFVPEMRIVGWYDEAKFDEAMNAEEAETKAREEGENQEAKTQPAAAQQTAAQDDSGGFGFKGKAAAAAAAPATATAATKF